MIQKLLGVALLVVWVQAQQENTVPDQVVAGDEKVIKLAGGMQFTEGPVWIPDGSYLLFSDIPANEIKQWKDGKLYTYVRGSFHTNGMQLDEKGRLLCCQHETRCVTRTEEDGRVVKLAGDYEGKKLNSPNDLTVGKDGTIWFTDPPYGLKNRKKELEGNFVFCCRPGKDDLKIVAKDFDRPNGLCLSPDEKKLYIADSGKPRHIRVFDVLPDGSLARGKVFCKIEPGAPDGIKCDAKGRIFSSAGDGVHLFSSKGKLLGKIPVPERPSNLCFGGKDGKVLFITARTSLYSVKPKSAVTIPCIRKWEYRDGQ